MSSNYRFVIDLSRAYCPPPARLLDFGCGNAEVAERALAAGYDAHGVDTYAGVGDDAGNLGLARARIGARLHTSSPGAPLPFAHGSFDVVIANQVFEHVFDLDATIEELARVVRPGGILVALMPTAEVLWEDHLKMPLVHWLPPASKRQRLALRLCRHLGFGRFREIDMDVWIDAIVAGLRDTVVHRPTRAYARAFAPTFDLRAEEEPRWARHQLDEAPRLRRLAPLVRSRVLDGLLRQAVRRAAGAVLVFERRSPGTPRADGRGHRDLGR